MRKLNATLVTYGLILLPTLPNSLLQRHTVNHTTLVHARLGSVELLLWCRLHFVGAAFGWRTRLCAAAMLWLRLTNFCELMLE